jgi:hypothetical protein
VITRKKDRQDVRVTKSMCGAECWTDHRLIVSKLKLRIQPARRPQGKKTQPRLDVVKLKRTTIKTDFANTMDERLQSISLDAKDVETNWSTLREMIYNTATEVLGPTTRKQNDWFDENSDDIKKLLDKKHKLYQAFILMIQGPRQRKTPLIQCVNAFNKSFVT